MIRRRGLVPPPTWRLLEFAEVLATADPNSVLNSVPTSFSSIELKASPGGDYSEADQGARWVFPAIHVVALDNAVSTFVAELEALLSDIPADNSGVSYHLVLSTTTDMSGKWWAVGCRHDSGTGKRTLYCTSSDDHPGTEESNPNTATHGVQALVAPWHDTKVYIVGISIESDGERSTNQAPAHLASDVLAAADTLYPILVVGRENIAGVETIGFSTLRAWVTEGPTGGV